MPLFFLVLGAALITSAIRGTAGLTDKSGNAGLLGLLQKDFTGSGNFGVWIVAVASVGALGTVPGFKTVSNGLLVLIVLGILLSNKGFFSQFSAAVQTQ